MKKLILFLGAALIFSACEKEPETDPKTANQNDTRLLGKWWLDSTYDTYTKEMTKHERASVCEFPNVFTTLKFSESIYTHYACLGGSEIEIDFNYKTENGRIVRLYQGNDVGGERYYLPSPARLVTVEESTYTGAAETDSTFNYYSR